MTYSSELNLQSIAKLSVGLFVLINIFACSPSPVPPPTIPSFTTSTVTDIDGNTYNTVIICGYEWMTENLKTTRYNDGTTIPQVTLNYLWDDGTHAWCYYNNDSTYNSTFGKLYNYDAREHIHSIGGPNTVEDLCPLGWHVAKKSDWEDLMNCLGTDLDHFAGYLKSLSLWTSPNTGATDVIGFAAFPGGYRSHLGSFSGMNTFAAFGAKYDNREQIWMYSTQEKVVYSDQPAAQGVSCRCVRD